MCCRPLKRVIAGKDAAGRAHGNSSDSEHVGTMCAPLQLRNSAPEALAGFRGYLVPEARAVNWGNSRQAIG